MPSPRKSDQSAPAAVGPTGAASGQTPDPRAQSGAHLTTAQGLRLPDTDHSLKAGARGPTLLEDFHLREKITHFDHERIPERVVHARGRGRPWGLRVLWHRGSGDQGRLPRQEGHQTPKSSPAFRPFWVHAARPTPFATPAGSP